MHKYAQRWSKKKEKKCHYDGLCNPNILIIERLVDRNIKSENITIYNSNNAVKMSPNMLSYYTFNETF